VPRPTGFAEVRPCGEKLISLDRGLSSDLLSRVERGEEILITKRSRPVAVLSPYRPPAMTPEREKAIRHAIAVMERGLRWGSSARRKFKRDEMHER
jgi:antitoxin (DNA-binding transcriptional repressor) of toxin-antitoxin stability system